MRLCDQVTLAVLVSGWAHVLHAMYKPWGMGSVMYALQHGSLFVTSFVFLMGLLFKVNGVSSTAPVYNVLSYVMLTMCVTFLVVWGRIIVKTMVSRVRSKRNKASAVGGRREGPKPGSGILEGRAVGTTSSAAQPQGVRQDASHGGSGVLGAGEITMHANPLHQAAAGSSRGTMKAAIGGVGDARVNGPLRAPSPSLAATAKALSWGRRSARGASSSLRQQLTSRRQQQPIAGQRTTEVTGSRPMSSDELAVEIAPTVDRVTEKLQ